MKPKPSMEVNEAMCPTCPFRDGSQYAYLVDALVESALKDCSRICHSTGTNDISGRTEKTETICRGARNVQLKVLHGNGFLPAPTDEAWLEKCREMNIQPNTNRKPK